LLKYRPLSNYERQSQLKTIFAKTNAVLLDQWNSNQIFEQAVHPQKVLRKWLGFRLDEGGNIEQFLLSNCRVNPAIAGFLISGHVFPNPLLYARRPEQWGKARTIDIASGFIHGDLNTNNILAKFSDDKESLEGYYLIDFALFKENMPLFYDQRYLEMSYLMHAMSQISFTKCANFLTLLAVADRPDPHKVPIEMSGISAVIASARNAFAEWVQENHPSLHDDLWGQYWLAGVAAGLAYCHKPGLAAEQRLAGLIYAATNLKRYSATFNLPLPKEVELLFDENQTDVVSPDAPKAKKLKQNLPLQPTLFIGRAAQIAAIKGLLMRPDVRLVTLIGPGGTGKTRLSLRVAEEMLDQFPDGVFFVPLADDTDTNQFVSRVAQQLEVREAGRPLLENVKDYLRDKHLLLVLDNFEQLVSTAPIVADLLATAPQLKILVSSRIALNLHGEYDFPVPPLELPPTENQLQAAELAENESILLFVERARAAQPNFSLTNDNASAVAQICQRLDGLPLAIELASARVKMLPPQAILARLSDRLKLLTGGAQDLPTRQRTLRNTLDWSYSLLNAQEKILYARLAVFVGGFTLEAAEAVCNSENNLDILEGVASLVNNSLLKQEDIAGEPRFRMLETIREYALERLVESGQMPELQRSHAHYYAGILNEASFRIQSREATAWLNRLEREHDNIQATLAWSITTPDGRALALSILAILTWFWYRRGFFGEGRVWTERILAASGADPDPARAAAFQMNSRMAMWRGDLNTAVSKARESLMLWQRLEDEEKVPMSLMETGVALLNIGQDSEAHILLKEAEALFKESG
jgi:predicted ATPase